MRQAAQHIPINGAHGEGGSAVLRTALVMSSLTQQPTRIFNVRGGTRKKGLTPEDLTIVEVLRASVKAEVEGDELGNDELVFEPRRAARAVHMTADVQSIQGGKVPGNAVVVAQAVAAVLARTGAYSSLQLFGETHNNNMMTYDSFEKTCIPAIARQGIYAFPTLSSAGFGYAGRGNLSVEIEPSGLNPVVWDRRGGLMRYGVVVTHCDAPNPTVREIFATAAQKLQKLGNQPDLEDTEIHGPESGIGVTFFAWFENGFGSGSACWNKGTSGSAVVERAWENFSGWLNSEATVDAYLADQLLIPAVMTEGRSFYSTPTVTRRLVSMASVVKQFMPIHVTVKGREGTPGQVIVER